MDFDFLFLFPKKIFHKIFLAIIIFCSCNSYCAELKNPFKLMIKRPDKDNGTRYLFYGEDFLFSFNRNEIVDRCNLDSCNEVSFRDLVKKTIKIARNNFVYISLNYDKKRFFDSVEKAPQMSPGEFMRSFSLSKVSLNCVIYHVELKDVSINKYWLKVFDTFSFKDSLDDVTITIKVFSKELKEKILKRVAQARSENKNLEINPDGFKTERHQRYLPFDFLMRIPKENNNPWPSTGDK